MRYNFQDSHRHKFCGPSGHVQLVRATVCCGPRLVPLWSRGYFQACLGLCIWLSILAVLAGFAIILMQVKWRRTQASE